MAHDLQKILKAIDLVYFDGVIADLRISWKKVKPHRPVAQRRWLYYANYYFAEREITVHPALNHDWVPNYFVTYVVFHEALHSIYLPQWLPNPKKPGELYEEVHPPDFVRAEQRYYHYERALAWEMHNLERLMRSKPGPRR